MADAGAAVVAHDVEAIEAQRRHHLDLVLGGGALAVVAEVVGSRLAAVAVAAQVGCHHRVVRGQRGRHHVPHHVALRVAVEQQERRALAALHQIDGGGRGLDLRLREAVEHGWLGRRGWVGRVPRIGIPGAGSSLGDLHPRPNAMVCRRNLSPQHGSHAGKGGSRAPRRDTYRSQERCAAGPVSAAAAPVTLRFEEVRP